MTTDALFRWMTRHHAEPPAPVCGLCFGASGHVPMNPGDGPPRCTACVYKRGRWAADPGSIDQAGLTALGSAHEDVVELRRCAAHTIEWNWIGWTRDADSLLDPGGAALVFGEALVVARQAESAGGLL